MKSRSLSPLEGNVIGLPVHAYGMEDALTTVSDWALKRESRAVYFCNAHSLATGRSQPAFGDVLLAADLRLPDGAPIAHLLRKNGFTAQERVSGPDLMLAYFRLAHVRSETVFLYGSTSSTLQRLVEKIHAEMPGLKVHAYSPPFRPLTAEEDSRIVERIRESGASTVWVALGCPKQEEWIAQHRGRIPAVMFGVGAAFAFHAGLITRAPVWMQKAGLEWLHRLLTDPKRLWKRYLVTNTQFLAYVLADKTKTKKAIAAREC